jgi:hypothetical protein
MPSDIEMDDSDPSILDTEITLDPEIITSIKPTPERVVHRYKKCLLHPGVRAAEAPSVIWRVDRNMRGIGRSSGLIKQ